MEVEGMKTYGDFDFIEIIDEGISYPALMGIGLENDFLVVINFRKRVMSFKNYDIWVLLLPFKIFIPYYLFSHSNMTSRGVHGDSFNAISSILVHRP